MKTTMDLISIAKAGAHIELDAERKTTMDLISIAKAGRDAKNKVTYKFS